MRFPSILALALILSPLASTAVFAAAEPPTAAVAGKPVACTDGDAAKHVGEEAIVSGTVIAVSTSRSGNLYVNFGGRFPNQTFSGVVKAADIPNVGDLLQLTGKRVSISGKIELYNGKPQIVVKAKDQLQVAEGGK